MRTPLHYVIDVQLRYMDDPRTPELRERYEHIEAQRKAAAVWLANVIASRGKVVPFKRKRS